MSQVLDAPELLPGAVVIQCAQDGCDAELVTFGGWLEHYDDGSHMVHYGPRTVAVSHLGWGGTTREVDTDVDLGRGRFRTPDFGVRRAVWDAAFGYVSGFRKRDILYYLLTRSLSRRVSDRVIAWEQRRQGE